MRSFLRPILRLFGVKPKNRQRTTGFEIIGDDVNHAEEKDIGDNNGNENNIDDGNEEDGDNELHDDSDANDSDSDDSIANSNDSVMSMQLRVDRYEQIMEQNVLLPLLPNLPVLRVLPDTSDYSSGDEYALLGNFDNLGLE